MGKTNLSDFDKGISIEDLEGIDDIVESSEIMDETTADESTTEETDNELNVRDSGVIDLNSADFEDIGTYKPVMQNGDTKKISDIISQNLSYIANKDSGTFAKKRKAMEEEIEAYKKDLIVNKGFTYEEATAAAEKRAAKRSIEEVNEYKTNNPEVAIIKVNKTDSDKIEIAPEDRAKVHKASAIRLIEVEDAELKHIRIKSHPSNSPISMARLNTCNLTRYTVPCINTVDMCTFDGTSTYALVNLYFGEDDDYKTRLTKQMDLVYDKFVSSTTKTKYTEAGALAMTKEDFLNWFAFADITAAMYAIYVASSTEIVTSPFECQNELCKDDDKGKQVPHKYDFTYNCKDIMKFDNIEGEFKEIYNGILQCKNDDVAMAALRNEKHECHRYKSSVTNNIYDIQTPSCARALEFTKFVNSENQLSDVYFGIAIHIAKIYLYCGEEEGEPVYAMIDSPEDIFHIVEEAIEPEFNLYTQKLVRDKTYSYETTLRHVCDKCGTETLSPLDVSALVFLKAQRMGSAIE